MTLRTSTNVLGLVLLLFSGFACALGLGEIKVNSAMNEPMDAEIEILNLGDLTENEIQVKLASAADFQNAGVDRLFHLVDLNFTLDLSSESRPLVRVSSQKAIKEPYLDFLIEMRWSSGRMLREYTVLMDLPAFAREKPVGKQVTATRSSSSTATATPVPPSRGTSVSSEPTPPPSQSPVPEAEAAVSQPSPALENDAEPGSYIVSAGDTLWAIAAGIRPAGVTVQQTIMAIYESNPEAFIDNNANLVRKGAVLRLPEASEIQNLSHQRAVNELTKHRETWQHDTEVRAPEATVEAVATVEEDVVLPDSETEGGRLRLSAADSGEGSESTGASGEGGTGDGSSRELIENDLAIAQEELDRTSRENAELKQKLKILEEQVESMSRLIELEDSGLRAVQLAAENREDLSGEGESFNFSDIVADNGAVEEAEELPGEAASLDEGGVVLQEIDPTVEEVADAPAEPTSAPPVTAAPAVTAEASAVSKEEGLLAKFLGLIASLKDLLLPIGGGLLALVGLIVMLRRRRSDADSVDSEMIEPDDTLRGSTEELVAPTAELGSVEDEIELDEEDLLFAEAAQHHVAGGGNLDLDESEKVDAVGEAEIYLSLGNHETAVGILLNALEQDPDDVRARLKLLEIYGEQKDESAFDEQASTLEAVANAEVMGEVERMRAASFGVRAPAATEADYIELPVDDDFSLDLDGDTDLTEAADAVSAELDDDLDLPDLDLSSELDVPDTDTGLDVPSEAVDSKVESEPASAEESDFDLDLDLDLDFGLDGADADPTGEGETLESPAVHTPATEGAEAASIEESVDLDLGEGFDLPDDSDEMGTQLELAQAYFDMGDSEGAREILEYVTANGSAEQRAAAESLLAKLN